MLVFATVGITGPAEGKNILIIDIEDLYIVTDRLAELLLFPVKISS